ncbi:hypothetical protein F0562_027815 [Nyssa sinensis]|uniref:Uncharacterized protein n=1 Tax=Nyssa sinensis TaxID=561372 RepID=A0A5J5B8W7_9ASTE|nr:hypothetical protein F0562_027815 [Nyssa sinensis]
MTHRTKLAIHNISETMGLELMMVFGEIIAAMAATALGQALPGCQERCCDVNVPYPFGIADGCRDINECKNDTLHECISAKNCHHNGEVIHVLVQGGTMGKVALLINHMMINHG